jgi:hypothetical protein
MRNKTAIALGTCTGSAFSAPDVSHTAGACLTFTPKVQEYDSVMLEAYELRSTLQQARKELAESLYEHDAACRTIARIMAEKDAAEVALEDLQSQIATMRHQAQAAAAGSNGHAEGPQPKRVRCTSVAIDACVTMRASRARCVSRHAWVWHFGAAACTAPRFSWGIFLAW